MTLIGAILLGAFLIVVFKGGFVILAIVFGIFFLVHLGTYLSYKNAKPSEMKCPNCHKENVKISLARVGSDSNFWATRMRYVGQMQAKCQDCGYVWEYLMQEDLSSAASKAALKAVIFAVLCAFSAYLGYIVNFE